MGRAAPPDPAVYEQLVKVLRLIEEQSAAIAAEHGLKVLIENNLPGSSRGGKFPYTTTRAVGLLEPEPFLCAMCGAPGTTTVTVEGEPEPRCDKHEDHQWAGVAA